VRPKPFLFGMKLCLRRCSLLWVVLCMPLGAATASEAAPDDSKVTAYIHCAVDFDMFQKILTDTPDEDKTRLFGEGIVALEEKSVSFFKTGSDFFVIQAVNLSSRENVAAVARQRFEHITAGFESDHQGQLDRIIANGYRCVELLRMEMQFLRDERDDGQQADG